MLKERLWSDDTMERRFPQGALSTHFSIHPLCQRLADAASAVGYRGDCTLGSSIDRHFPAGIAKVRDEGTLVCHLSLRKPSIYPCILAWEPGDRAYYPGISNPSLLSFVGLLLVFTCSWLSPKSSYTGSMVPTSRLVPLRTVRILQPSHSSSGVFAGPRE